MRHDYCTPIASLLPWYIISGTLLNLLSDLDFVLATKFMHTQANSRNFFRGFSRSRALFSHLRCEGYPFLLAFVEVATVD